MMNKKLLGFASISLIAACNKPAVVEEKKIVKPNIIFILADDLGYGDIGCYGQKTIKTPNIDQMASEGIRFTQHYAGSTVSAPSRCCLMTGKHTGHAVVRGNINVPLKASDTTVAELLKSAGYKTALVGKWGLGEQGSSGIPNKKGFDYFYGYLNQIHAHNSYPEFLWRDTNKVWLKNKVELMQEGYGKGIGGCATEKKEFSNALFTQEAMQFLKNNSAGDPFFLYLAYTIPHANNEASHFNQCPIEVPDLGQYKDKPWPEAERAKAAAISFLDSDIGQIVALVKSLKLDKNTIIIFSSDNGPHQEGVDPEFFNSNGSLQGIKRDMFEGGIRVPMVVWAPAIISKNKVSDHVSAFWDFLPTACDLAGVQIPSWTDGISFVSELTGKPQKQHEYLYWEFFEQGGKQAVLYNQNMKGIRLNVDKDSAGLIYLYDLKSDISEQNCFTPQNLQLAGKVAELMKSAHSLSPDFKFEYEKGELQKNK